MYNVCIWCGHEQKKEEHFSNDLSVTGFLSLLFLLPRFPRLIKKTVLKKKAINEENYYSLPNQTLFSEEFWWICC